MADRLYTDLSDEQVLNYVRRLQAVAGRLTAIAMVIGEKGFDVVPMRSSKTMDTGVDFVESFAQAAEKGLGNYIHDPDKKSADVLNAELEAEKKAKTAKAAKNAKPRKTRK
jgi:hypothetical protein